MPGGHGILGCSACSTLLPRNGKGSWSAQPALTLGQGRCLLSAANLLCSRSKSTQSRGERRCRDWDASALGCFSKVWCDLTASIRAPALLAGQKGTNLPREGSGGGTEGKVPSTTAISTSAGPSSPTGALTGLLLGVRWPHGNKLSPWLGSLM